MIVIIIGGIVVFMYVNGGIIWLIECLICKVMLKKGVEFSIVGLVSFLDVIMVNNIIVIVIVGLIVKDLNEKYGVDFCCIVLFLDIFLCSF